MSESDRIDITRNARIQLLGHQSFGVDITEIDIANYCHGERAWQATRSADFVLDDRQVSQRTSKAKPICISNISLRRRVDADEKANHHCWNWVCPYLV